LFSNRFDATKGTFVGTFVASMVLSMISSPL